LGANLAPDRATARATGLRRRTAGLPVFAPRDPDRGWPLWQMEVLRPPAAVSRVRARCRKIMHRGREDPRLRSVRCRAITLSVKHTSSKRVTWLEWPWSGRRFDYLKPRCHSREPPVVHFALMACPPGAGSLHGLRRAFTGPAQPIGITPWARTFDRSGRPVERCLLGSPVQAGAPVAAELAHVRHAEAILPSRLRHVRG
jgi:hypothetical protein